MGLVMAARPSIAAFRIPDSPTPRLPSVVPVSAGAEGLIIGDRVGTTNKPKPDDAVVH